MEGKLLPFPQDHREDGATFLVDRIQPIPEDACGDLIGLYFEDDDEVQAAAEQDDDNYDCLVRIYLGENESQKQQSETYESLRNFPLRLNMIYALGILKADRITQAEPWEPQMMGEMKKLPLATEMAIGLAIIQWQAKVDGMDCEFVLGGAASNGIGGVRLVRLPQSRPVHLWMLDFDKTSTIHFTPEDVDRKLVLTFLGNDP